MISLINFPGSFLRFPLLLLALFFTSSIFAQKTPATPAPSPANPSHAKAATSDQSDPSALSEAELLAAQQRTFAISLVRSLSDEARSYRNLSLRARVLARAADALWTADSNEARAQFRRAWEAAEKADSQEASPQTKNARPMMVIGMKKMMSTDSRTEVLTLAARRDRALGEEFLAKLTAGAKSDADSNEAGKETTNDSWSTSPAATKRLLLARKLLEEDQIERALEFAAPVLNQVNEKTIGFLSALRAKRPELADQRFALLLASAALDPSADANTVSGLSSYAFTPGFYVTFVADGGVRWTPTDDPNVPPSLPPAVLNRFFQVAAAILLRPLPPPEQDVSSAGRTGRYLVTKRLLPLFDQYAPDTAVALRSQLTALAGERLTSGINDENSLMTQGIEAETTAKDALEKMQDQLDHARTSFEREKIYSDVAVVLATQGDVRGQDLADKIDSSEWRALVREFVDVRLAQSAIQKKDTALMIKLATKGVLGHAYRAWAYTQTAHLLMNSDRPRAVDLLDEALAEARRLDADDPKRASVLMGVTAQFLNADRPRVWDVIAEAVKAANATEEFSGEDVGLNLLLATRNGLKLIEIDGSDFSLGSALRSLAKDDLMRAHDLARSFKYDAPRAAATLAVARSVLTK